MESPVVVHKDAPAFDFYPERWLAGVAEFSDAEQISYLRLLCFQWLNQGLPEDMKKLRKMAGRGVTPALLTKFPVNDDGQRRNPRLELVRAAQRDRIAVKRLGGALTNARRYGIASLSEEDRALLAMSEKGRQLLASEVASDTLAGSVAPRHHSPPTTHPTSTTTTPAPVRAGGFCTLEQARAYAESYSKGNPAGLNIPMQVVTQWHDDRESTGWVTVKGGVDIPIVDWQADLRKFATHYTRNDQAMTPVRSGSNGRQPVKLTTTHGWGPRVAKTSTTAES